jgi:hypothetical protein
MIARHPRLVALAVPLAGLVAINVAGPFIGDTPDTRDTGEQVVAYFTGHRTDVMTGVALLGVAMMAFLATVVRVGALLVSAGRVVAGRFVQATGTVVVTMFAVTSLLPLGSLAYVVAADEPQVARAMFVTTLVAATIMTVPLAAMLLTVGVALWLSGAMPRWFAVVAFLLGVVVALGVGGWAFSGFFSPDVQQQSVLMSIAAWLLTVGFAVPTERRAASDPAISGRSIPPPGAVLTENPSA